MISSYNLASGLEIFKALSSELRVQIYRTVSENEGINLRQLAHELRIPMSTLSPHMQLLRNSELIYLIEQNTPQGKQKCCYLKNRSEQFAITVTTPQNNIRTARSEIPLGCYTDFSVTPTCGLASRTAFIGKLDQPRAFTLMERYQANILWFRTGYLEYVLPNPLPSGSRIEQISISFEIGSESPQTNNDYPSDIGLSLNGRLLGIYRSPGDFGDRSGKQNPKWWYPFLNQYGILNKLKINRMGTWLNEEPFSQETLQSLGITAESVLHFRFSVDENARHPGGCTLFGQGFGDSPQSIRVSIRYFSQ